MTFTETSHAGGFLISEANGHFARDNGTLNSGQKLDAGAVLGRITATGHYTAVAPAANDGSEEAAAVLYAGVDATDADAPCVVILRGAEVNRHELIWPNGMTAPQIATATGQLIECGVIAR